MMVTGNASHRFMRAVWDLHSRMFQNYFDWCKHVGLVSRPSTAAAFLRSSEPYTDEVAIMLMMELGLYFCIWTEAANLRYMPESIWFIFWTMRFSSTFAELVGSGERKGDQIIPVPADPMLVSYVPMLR